MIRVQSGIGHGHDDPRTVERGREAVGDVAHPHVLPSLIVRDGKGRLWTEPHHGRLQRQGEQVRGGEITAPAAHVDRFSPFEGHLGHLAQILLNGVLPMIQVDRGDGPVNITPPLKANFGALQSGLTSGEEQHVQQSIVEEHGRRDGVHRAYGGHPVKGTKSGRRRLKEQARGRDELTNNHALHRSKLPASHGQRHLEVHDHEAQVRPGGQHGLGQGAVDEQAFVAESTEPTVGKGSAVVQHRRLVIGAREGAVGVGLHLEEGRRPFVISRGFVALRKRQPRPC